MKCMLWLLPLLLSALSACRSTQEQRSETRLIDAEALPDNHPLRQSTVMVGDYVGDKFHPSCSGSLIQMKDESHAHYGVLTAAHCVRSLEYLHVAFGDRGESFVKVLETKPYQHLGRSYDSAFQPRYDLALLTFEQIPDMEKHELQAVAILNDPSLLEQPDEAIIVGNGINENNFGGEREFLPVRVQRVQAGTYKGFIATKSDSGHGCGGDSGGGLFLRKDDRWYLAGVASRLNQLSSMNFYAGSHADARARCKQTIVLYHGVEQVEGWLANQGEGHQQIFPSFIRLLLNKMNILTKKKFDLFVASKIRMFEVR